MRSIFFAIKKLLVKKLKAFLYNKQKKRENNNYVKHSYNISTKCLD